jgi:hypothetical protein
MNITFDEWKKMMKPSCMFKEAVDVGEYMITPVSISKSGCIVRAETVKCDTSQEAIDALKSMKILYVIAVATPVSGIHPRIRKPFSNERKRKYIIRGVW